jgi:serine/threonine protein kinase
MCTEITLNNIEAEVRRANCSRHRNVVHVFGTVQLDDDTVGIVMERLGMSLAGALAHKQVTEESLRMKYTLDIIAGMRHMHRPGQLVVHFDLKPENILLTHDRRSIKIIDFGVSQTATTMDKAEPTKRGTVPYLAPELFFKPPTSSAACDVYSCAVVLAELWTGAVAWENIRDHDELIGFQVKQGSRPFSPDYLKEMRVPAHIIALIEKCWAQEPLHRPTFAHLAELKHKPHAGWPQPTV